MNRFLSTLACGVLALLAVAGCDAQRIQELQPLKSSDADVVARFGQPDFVWPRPDGSSTFEYDRQPAGHVNYMIDIDPQGRMVALRQVLVPAEFAKVQPGMSEVEVRRLLGMPAKRMPLDLVQETHWDWNWMDPPNREMVFSVVFGPQGQVLRTASTDKLPEGR